MKFRLDFVTNSSSSCYICEICGAAEESYDGPNDAGMYECENGHMFCQNEALNVSKPQLLAELLASGVDFDKEESDLERLLQEIVEEKAEYGYTPAVYCPICQFKHWTDYDMSAYLGKKYNFTFADFEKQFAEKYGEDRVCKPSEYHSFMAVKFGFALSDILLDWKRDFGDYKEFTRYIRGK